MKKQNMKTNNQRQKRKYKIGTKVAFKMNSLQSLCPKFKRRNLRKGWTKKIKEEQAPIEPKNSLTRSCAQRCLGRCRARKLGKSSFPRDRQSRKDNTADALFESTEVPSVTETSKQTDDPTFGPAAPFPFHYSELCGLQFHQSPLGGRRRRIIGGSRAQFGEFPWQVTRLFIKCIFGVIQVLLSKLGGGMCGGSLLTTTWVITAAHCFKGKVAQLS